MSQVKIYSAKVCPYAQWARMVLLGRFVCTMQNPMIRRPKVDGCLRLVGDCPLDDGTLVVSGFERGGDPVVSRLRHAVVICAPSWFRARCLSQSMARCCLSVTMPSRPDLTCNSTLLGRKKKPVIARTGSWR